MKWLVGLLLILNAGLFLWATGHKPKTTDFIRPPVNGETMMLISEMKPVKVTGSRTGGANSQQAPAETINGAGQSANEERREPADQPAEQEVVEVTRPPLCLRVGPFFDEKLAGETADRLRTLTLAVDMRTVKSREIRAYRVYVGPFENSAESKAQQKILVESGVKDHYVKREEGKKDIISLGLFTQNTGAAALTEQLKEKGVVASTRTEDRKLDPTYWLELTDSEANRAAHAELAAAKTWGDERTKLSEFPCS